MPIFNPQSYSYLPKLPNQSYFEQPFTNATQVSYTHNLGEYADVFVLNSAGDRIGCRIYQTINTVMVEFNQSISGTLVIRK